MSFCAENTGFYVTNDFRETPPLQAVANTVYANNDYREISGIEIILISVY